MTCYKPLSGYRARVPEASGKYKIVFNPMQGYLDLPVTVPCGQCIGCRLERSRQWAMRCVFESSLHVDNCFITLTYDDDHLPANKSLDVTHFQKFMKRLRFEYGNGIRFFHCGEYGDKYGRPHYHAILFNCDFPDKYFWQMSGNQKLYRSDILEELWPFGISSIGEVTVKSVAYVARYTLKKRLSFSTETGLCKPVPEYVTMSRRPGIASEWFNLFCTDVYPNDSLIFNGLEYRPPRYFDKLLEKFDPVMFEDVVYNRYLDGVTLTQKLISEYPSEELIARRLDTLRRCKEYDISRLVRVLDSDI